MKIDKNIVQENIEQLSRFQFAIENRTTPTIVFIDCENEKTKIEFFEKINKSTHYGTIKFDLSNLSIDSLGQFLLENLDAKLFDKTDRIAHIVHLFGIEDSILSATKESLGVKKLAKTINFEREVLFRDFPIILTIWTNKLTIFQLQKYAPDFWDWVTNSFRFRDPKIPESDYDFILERIDLSNYVREENIGDQLIYIEELKDKFNSLKKNENDRGRRNELVLLKSIAKAYKQIEYWEAAVAYFEKCVRVLNKIDLKLERETISFNIYLAQSLVEINQYEKASEIIKPFFTTKDTVAKAEVFLEYGKIKEREKNIKEAANYYKKSVELLRNV